MPESIQDLDAFRRQVAADGTVANAGVNDQGFASARILD